MLAAVAASAVTAQADTEFRGLLFGELRLQTLEINLDQHGARRQRTLHKRISKRGLLRDQQLSPDGQKLAYVNDSGLVLAELSGPKPQTRAFKTEAYSYQLAWCPQSRWLAFLETSEAAETLRVLDTQSKAKHLKASSVVQRASPTIIRAFHILSSSDGSRPKLLWHESSAKSTGFRSCLFTQILGQPKSRKLVFETRGMIDDLQVDPQDPERALVDLRKTTSQLLQLSLKTGKTRCLASLAGSVRNIDWSPNGHHLAVYFEPALQSSPFGGVAVVLFDLRKTGESCVVAFKKASNVNSLRFSPTGQKLAWAQGAACWVQDLKDLKAKPRRILAPGEPGQQRPIRGFAWRPDGQELALVAGHQLWFHRLSSKTTVFSQEFGRLRSHFLFQPDWRGQRLRLLLVESTNLSDLVDREASLREQRRRARLKAKGARLY